MDIKNTVMRNGILETSITDPDELFLLDRKFREAFLDNKIPITKIIGFYLEDSEKSKNFATRRSTYCLNNPIELSSNLSKVVVEKTNSKITRTLRMQPGDINSNNLQFIINANRVNLLTKDLYLFTLLKPASLCAFLYTNTGFKRIEDNVKIMKQESINMPGIDPDRYYPLNSLHSVAEDIFILPFNGKEIRYRLKNPSEDATFSSLWSDYISEVEK